MLVESVWSRAQSKALCAAGRMVPRLLVHSSLLLVESEQSGALRAAERVAHSALNKAVRSYLLVVIR